MERPGASFQNTVNFLEDVKHDPSRFWAGPPEGVSPDEWNWMKMVGEQYLEHGISLRKLGQLYMEFAQDAGVRYRGLDRQSLSNNFHHLITLLYAGSPDWIKEKYPFETLALGKPHSEPQRPSTHKETNTPVIEKTRILLTTLGELHLGAIINLRGRSHIMNSLAQEEEPLIVPFASVAEDYHISGRDVVHFVEKLVRTGATIIETTNRASKLRSARVWRTHWVLKIEEGFARDTLNESEELAHFKVNPVTQLTGDGPPPRISELWNSREYSGLVSFLQTHGVHIEGKSNRRLVESLLVGCPGRVYKVETQKRCRFLYKKKADEAGILQHALRRYKELSFQEAV